MLIFLPRRPADAFAAVLCRRHFHAVDALCCFRHTLPRCLITDADLPLRMLIFALCQMPRQRHCRFAAFADTALPRDSLMRAAITMLPPFCF